MPFTEQERRAWHRAKQDRERRNELPYREQPLFECIHCQQPFGISGGVVTGQVFICDICLGD